MTSAKPSDKVRTILGKLGIDDSLAPGVPEEDWQAWLDFFEAPETRTCPECGAPMHERNGKFGEFWGCSRWPDCEYTESIEGGNGLST